MYDRARGLLLGGGGHVMDASVYGVAAVNSGAAGVPEKSRNRVFLIDAPNREVWALRIFHRVVDAYKAHFSEWSMADLLLHGVFYSATSRRLYAVNHRLTHSSVEIFEVREQANGGAAHDDPPMRHFHQNTTSDDRNYHPTIYLIHLHSVRAPADTFQHVALNDVIEGDPDGSEFYVTEWQAHDHGGGSRNQGAFAKVREIAMQLGKVKRTRLLRCAKELPNPDEKATWSCAPATPDLFVAANGITTTFDRRYILLSDPPASTIYIYQRDDSPARLKFVGSFQSHHIVDNLEVVESPASTTSSVTDGGIVVVHAGTLPVVFSSSVGCEGGFGMTRTITSTKDGSRGKIGCGRSPGTLLEIRIGGLYSAGGGSTVGRGELDIVQEDRLAHDGSVLSDFSAAIEMDGVVVAGSPRSSGVLICDL